MPKDILIYGTIDEYNAAAFINGVDEHLESNPNAELVVRINTNGGSPEYTWGMISKFKEVTASKKVKNDGKSYSMGLYYNCYVENSEAVDTACFLLHRAAYASWVESNPDYFTEPMRKNLEAINKSLRAAFEAKVNVETFLGLKSVKALGVTSLDEVFSMENRIDIPLTAKEAKQIGLINTIVNITPKIKAEIEQYESAAFFKDQPKAETKQTTITTKKPNIMTVEEYKAAHPEAFAKIVELGVKKERDRVGSIMAYSTIDPEACKKVIESGETLTETQRSEFHVKAMSKGISGSIAADNKEVPEVKTAETQASAEAAAKEKKEADFLKEAGI